MAGHSKWANIKHRKGAQDKKRGKLFTKLIREITVAARIGASGDVGQNPRLRTAVDKALSNNMPRDTIDRAIKRGVGGDDGANLENIRYEGYGPGGVAVLVECLSDNRNRTVSEVRHAFSKCGGNLGTDGSVAYLFDRLGEIRLKVVEEDAAMEQAIEAGASDIEQEDGVLVVLTEVPSLHAVQDALKPLDAGLTAEIVMRPQTTVALDADTAMQLMKLVDMLEDLDDVQEVFSNALLTDEVLAQLNDD